MSEGLAAVRRVVVPPKNNKVKNGKNNSKGNTGWMRDRRGEWQFDDDPAGLGILIVPTWIVWCMVSSGIVFALPLPADVEVTAMLTGNFVGLPFALSIPALVFLGHRYRDGQVALAAEMLAQEGLLRGRGGRRRRKVLNRMDKMAAKITSTSAELDRARWMLERAGTVEPLLLAEMDDRAAVLKNELKAQRRQAEAYARQEKINAIGTDEDIAANQRQNEATFALNHAMQALEKSRNVIYR